MVLTSAQRKVAREAAENHPDSYYEAVAHVLAIYPKLANTPEGRTAINKQLEWEYKRLESLAEENPVAAKKKTRKKPARKNPRKVKATKSYHIVKVDGKGVMLGIVKGHGTKEKAEKHARRLCKGKVAKVILDY